MNSKDLKDRTKRFALSAIRLVDDFPKNRLGDVIGRQLLKSATSVGANYRSACRAKSHADFISKINIVEEEADESLYWLELSVESGLVSKIDAEDLLKEANELAAIFTSSRKTASKKKRHD